MARIGFIKIRRIPRFPPDGHHRPYRRNELKIQLDCPLSVREGLAESSPMTKAGVPKKKAPNKYPMNAPRTLYR